MNHYFESDGTRISQATLERRVTQAKKVFIGMRYGDNTYAFCDALGRNVSNESLDCSHIISIADCKAYRCAELAYDIDNLQLESRAQHLIYENGTLEEKQKQKNWEYKCDYVASKNMEIFNKRFA